MSLYDQISDPEQFARSIFGELDKLPFGSLPKVELELVILDAIVRSIEPNDPYAHIEKHFNTLKTKLKLSQTQLKNKILAAQLRFDTKTDEDVEHYIINCISTNNFAVEGNNLIISIFNPLLNDIAKSYLETKNIVSDSSFNKSLLKINLNGLFKIIGHHESLTDENAHQIELLIRDAQENGLLSVKIDEQKNSLEKFEFILSLGNNVSEFLSKLTPHLINLFL
jgi:hypothetical protein